MLRRNIGFRPAFHLLSGQAQAGGYFDNTTASTGQSLSERHHQADVAGCLFLLFPAEEPGITHAPKYLKSWCGG